jgi:hypothetical protein
MMRSKKAKTCYRAGILLDKGTSRAKNFFHQSLPYPVRQTLRMGDLPEAKLPQ